MGCKFVRDVEKFNKWGVKADYTVMKYGVEGRLPEVPGQGWQGSRNQTVRWWQWGWDEPLRHPYRPARAEG
jgi:hypothetical protein